MSYYIPSGIFAKVAQAAAAPQAAAASRAAANAGAASNAIPWSEIPVVNSGAAQAVAAPAAFAAANDAQARLLGLTVGALRNGIGVNTSKPVGANQAKMNRILNSYEDVADTINSYRGSGVPAGFATYANNMYGNSESHDGRWQSTDNYAAPSKSQQAANTRQTANTAKPSGKSAGKGNTIKQSQAPLTDWHDNNRDVTYDASVGASRPYSKSYAEGDPTASAYMAGQEAAAQMAANAMQAPTEMTRGWAEGENAPEPIIKATDPFDQLVAAYGLNEGGTGQINPELMKQYYINRGTVPDMEAAEGLYNILRGAY